MHKDDGTILYVLSSIIFIPIWFPLKAKSYIDKVMLCRACGNEMIPFEYCSHCNESTQWKCSVCSKESEKSIHMHNAEGEKFLRKASETAGAAMLTFVSGLSCLALLA